MDLGFSLYPLNADAPSDIVSLIQKIGADSRAAAYILPKRNVRHIYVKDADFRACAYLKQELLARGGDALVSRHVIDASADKSDALLLGTDGIFAALLQKMKAMDCWGLRELREELSRSLKNMGVRSWTFPLPEGRELALDGDTKIMGILNLTPDSFHAPSRVKDTDSLLSRADQMLKDGADVLDIGAESTRPGSSPLPIDQEIERLIPALRELRRAFPKAVLSVDTYKGRAASAAADAGADIINDVGGFGLDPDMLPCAAKIGLPYVLSHIKGKPRDMQDSPSYDDLLTEMNAFFHAKIEKAEKAGLPAEHIIIDPGLGFGKRTKDNLLIIKEIESFSVFGRPILLGSSRKGFIGKVSGASRESDRLFGTAAISALTEGRVHLTRVHDVAENKEAVRVARAVREALE
ncbi:dihydropteroate synthase [Synergistales bacterium]|nr:dihydropteroate synthase [Synergistales bacterium]